MHEPFSFQLDLQAEHFPFRIKPSLPLKYCTHLKPVQMLCYVLCINLFIICHSCIKVCVTF